MNEFAYLPGDLPEESVTIPLVIYIGEEKKIAGEAIIKGDLIEAHIDPGPVPAALVKAARDGILQNISVILNAPPATPVLENGTIKWVMNF